MRSIEVRSWVIILQQQLISLTSWYFIPDCSPLYFTKRNCSLYPTFTSCPVVSSLWDCTNWEWGKQLLHLCSSIQAIYLQAIICLHLFWVHVLYAHQRWQINKYSEQNHVIRNQEPSKTRGQFWGFYGFFSQIKNRKDLKITSVSFYFSLMFSLGRTSHISCLLF